MSGTIRLVDPVRSFADYVDSRSPTDQVRQLAYMLFGIIAARQEKSHLIFPQGLNSAPSLVVWFAKSKYQVMVSLDSYGMYVSEATPNSADNFWMTIDEGTDADYIFHRMGDL